MTKIDGMQAAAWFEDEFRGTRVMAILRGLGPDRTLQLARIAWNAGVRVLEVPVQGQQDLATLRLVAAEAAERGLRVGAGTVVEAARLPDLVAAGASYTVSPGVDEDVVRASLAAGLPTLPGVATASDIQRCGRMGLTWLKAFPAEQLTAGWLTAMHGPYPNAVFVATGGIRAANAAEFLAAGARVVSFGSALAQPVELAAMSEFIFP